MQPVYQTTYCMQCRAAVQVPQVGSAPCPYCGTYNAAPAQMPVQPPMGMPMQGGAPGMGVPQAQPPGMGVPQAQPPGLGGGTPLQAPQPQPHQAQPGGYAHMSSPAPNWNVPSFAYKMTRFKVIGIVVGGLLIGALAVGAFVLKKRIFGKKGEISYRKLGIDRSKADPDLMISELAPHARRWKRDAAWWSVNIHGIGPDGLVDLTGPGTASIRYVSPSRVQSYSKRRRRDSIKNFTFGRSGVRHKGKIGTRRAWKNVVLPPTPTCGIKQLAQSLRPRGLTDGKTIRVSFDPKFAYGFGAPKELSWRVFSDVKALEGWYSMGTCERVQP